MSPELAERQREFEWAKLELAKIIAGIDDAGFNRRPAVGAWSIAECVDHLITVGGKLITPMNQALERGRARGWEAAGPFRYSRWGDWFVRQSGADQLPPPRKLKAPRLYQPRPRLVVNVSQSVHEFNALQDDLVRVAMSADGLDLARIKVSSPAFRLVRLSLGQWLRLLSGHQRRHLWQASEAKSRLGASQVKQPD